MPRQLLTLFVALGVALALPPTASAERTAKTASKAERAVHHTLVRHGLARSATVSMSKTTYKHKRRGVVSCQVSFVLTFTGETRGATMQTAKVKGSGTVTSRRLPLSRAKDKCAVAVAQELASTRARRFIQGRSAARPSK